ncbi:MAG: sulfotransferase, partial [Solirubrobacterales bacterium]
MTILIQGMRRSGTTILYDALLEDPGLRCFYEPLREDTETPGGGSGARATDPFAETRALRTAYRDAHHPGLEIEQFNWGGPGEPAREIGPGLPDHCTGFISQLLEEGSADGREPMVKFTRIYAKLDRIAPLAPKSILVHVVRDPRAVAASMMMGKGRKRAGDYEHPGSFFDERSRRKLWSSRELSEELRETEPYSRIEDPANFERILMVWKYTFER